MNNGGSESEREDGVLLTFKGNFGGGAPQGCVTDPLMFRLHHLVAPISWCLGGTSDIWKLPRCCVSAAVSASPCEAAAFGMFPISCCAFLSLRAGSQANKSDRNRGFYLERCCSGGAAAADSADAADGAVRRAETV